MQVRRAVFSFSVSSDGARDCFVAYVTTKVVKQTQDFKARYTKDAQPRKVLLPLSLGPSSTTLLHLLDEQYTRQLQKLKRTGFELLVLYVTNTGSDLQPAYEALKERFPSHRYELLPLHDVFRYLPNLDDIMFKDESKVLTQDTPNLESKGPEEKLCAFLSSIPSASSKGDLLRILRLRLIVSYAKDNGCECITWGDSTTRLAEKTLSETANGRGMSMPWQIGEGQSPYGVDFKFPMRGLLRKEITEYSHTISPPLTPFVIDEPTILSTAISSKDMTIDALMGRYFASVEHNYPSIVTNVVRTANRLEAPRLSASTESCIMCGMPFEIPAENHAGPPSQETDSLTNAAGNGVLTKRFCHGCSTSLLMQDRRS